MDTITYANLLVAIATSIGAMHSFLNGHYKWFTVFMLVILYNVSVIIL